jgi:hypothetical protein
MSHALRESASLIFSMLACNHGCFDRSAAGPWPENFACVVGGTYGFRRLRFPAGETLKIAFFPKGPAFGVAFSRKARLSRISGSFFIYKIHMVKMRASFDRRSGASERRITMRQKKTRK